MEAGLEVEERAFGATETRPAPLIVSLHGRGGQPGLPNLARVAGECRVWLPRGPHRVGEGHAWSPHSVTARERHGELASDVVASADRLAAAIASAATRTRGRAIVVGYSQGAIVGLALALRHPALVSSAVLGASWLPPALEPPAWSGPRPRIRAYHGDADPIVPISETAALFTRLATLGLDVELRRFEGADHVASAEMSALSAEWIGDAVARLGA